MFTSRERGAAATSWPATTSATDKTGDSYLLHNYVDVRSTASLNNTIGGTHHRSA